MRTEAHTNPSVFDTLEDEWDSLLDPNSSTNFFLQLDWVRLWWKHMARGELAIVTVHDENNKLIGIAPWFIESNDDGKLIVRILGCTEIVDYLDLIATPGCEELVANELLDFMLSDKAPAWDQFALCNIPQSSSFLQLLPETAARHGLETATDVAEVCPVITLPDTYEEYLAKLDKKQRHELRRKRRRAEAEKVGWYIVGQEHDLDEEIEAFLELMAQSHPEKAKFLQLPGHRAFFKESGPLMFKKGYLDLIFLTVDGKRAATMWQFGYRDRLMLYNSGLNPADFSHLSPGIVLLTYSVEDAIVRRFNYYDFLRGDEQYKFRMGSSETLVHNITIKRA